MKTCDHLLLAVLLTITLTACLGGGDGGGSTPAVVSPTVSTTEPKVLTFSWNDVGADYYKLLKNPDGISGYTQVGADIFTTSVDETIPVHLQDWVNASYIIQSCEASDVCTDSPSISATSLMLDAIGYFKASNTESYDTLGYSMSLSGDGNTLAVGAYGEDSSATGINGDQTDNSAPGAGAVYVFSRSSGNWTQQAYVKASNTESDDRFGIAVSLSGDGNTLAAATTSEGSSATGINGDQTDNSAPGAGAVYVFSRSSGNWTQQAYIKASNTESNDDFGHAVSLSGDGNTLAVGAYGEDSSATGINGDQMDNSTFGAGAVYVFSRSGIDWSQQAYIKASNTGASDYFGYKAVNLSGDGNTLAVGAYGEASSATGINGDQTDNSASRAGAVYVFSRSGTDWTQQAYVKATNTESEDWFGIAVSLSGDGNTLAVGAHHENSSATGLNGDQADNSASWAGAVYVFSRSGTDWSHQAYVKASNTDESDEFGYAVSLSGDGNTLAVGANHEDSSATGINGDQTDYSAVGSGAVYVFSRSGTDWSQQAYVKASNTGDFDAFGLAASLSGDGNTLAVSSRYKYSNAGAAYLY